MSERCPKCHAKLGRCDCSDVDSEMIANRIENIETAITLLAEAIFEVQDTDCAPESRHKLRSAAKEALSLIELISSEE